MAIVQAPSFGAHLNGSDISASFELLVTVTDTRLVADGWRLEGTTTLYSSGGGSPRLLPATASSQTGATASCNSGFICLAPLNTVVYPLTLPAGASLPAPVRLFNSAGLTGTGQHTIRHQIRVVVPANSYAGTYTSTITVTIASGP